MWTKVGFDTRQGRRGIWHGVYGVMGTREEHEWWSQEKGTTAVRERTGSKDRKAWEMRGKESRKVGRNRRGAIKKYRRGQEESGNRKGRRGKMGKEWC